MAGHMNYIFSFLLFLIINKVFSSDLTNKIDEDVLTTKAYVFWPNATIPFYIDKDHFDNEQSVKIMTALSMFAFKTCLKFAPVMARPEDSDHVLLLENLTGVRKCTISPEPHSIEEPHRVTLGYDCLKSPEIDMMIMKALGFPFEHNRAVRDLYIDVQPENVEPGYLEFFTRDLRLPLELRAIPYDPNSVLHFGQREFSKNGHRTIIFKNRNLRQERFGLSPLDLRKIDVVYGPECRTRDRQEKIELCQNYPGVARRKREAQQSLRVNPDITPPPNIEATDNETQAAIAYTNEIEKQLGIEKELEEVVEKVNKVAAMALQYARQQKCDNKTKQPLRTSSTDLDKPRPKVLDILGNVAVFAHDLVKTATQNLTEFCMAEKSVDDYQRAGCSFFDKNLCRKHYKSTKSGLVHYSTQHRPILNQPTRVWQPKKVHFAGSFRSRNDTSKESPSNSTSKVEQRRNKRDTSNDKQLIENLKRRFESQRFRAQKGKEKRVQQEKEWDNSALTAEKGGRNTNKEKKRQGSENKRMRNDDDAKDYMNEGRELDKNKRKEIKHEDKQEGNKRGLKFRDKRQRHDNYGYKPKYGEKESIYIHKDPSYNDKNERGGDKKTRFEIRDPNNEKEANYRNKDTINDYNEPTYEEIKPRFEKKTMNQRQVKGNPKETPKDKNRFKSQKPPPSKASAEIEEGIESKTSEEQNANQNEQSREYKVKKKIIAENSGGDSHSGVAADDGEQEQNRPVSGENDGGSNGENTESPTPKRPIEKYLRPIDKKSKNRQKLTQKKPSKHREEMPEQTGGLPKVLKLDKKNREFYDERKWPDGVVRYVIKPPPDVDVEDVRARLDEVNQILKRKTCARLEELTEAEAENYEDYLVLDNSPDYVTGRVGGRQTYGMVELLRGGQHRQHSAMMVMAMLGFYFEVSRHDRDKFIRVHMRHVRPDKLHHFEKIREDATFPLPYDYKSATHPAWQFWRQIGKSGISTVATLKQTDPDGQIMKSLGQNRQLLSDLDILKINSVYGIDCFTKSAHRERHSEEVEGGEGEEGIGREGEEEEKRKTEEEGSDSGEGN